MDFAFAPPFGGLAYRDSIARLFAAGTLFLLRNTQKPKKSPRAAGAKKPPSLWTAAGCRKTSGQTAIRFLDKTVRSRFVNRGICHSLRILSESLSSPYFLSAAEQNLFQKGFAFCRSRRCPTTDIAE